MLRPMRVESMWNWRWVPAGVGVLVALALDARICAAERDAAEPKPNHAITAEEILANPLDESEYARKIRCLAAARYRRVEIVGNMALVFHGRGEEVWLNVLPRRCPGLRKNMALAIERGSLRICARDRFRGISPGGLDLPTSTCSLGPFEPMTPEQLDAMRDALVAQQNTKTIDRTVRAGQNENAAANAGHASQ